MSERPNPVYIIDVDGDMWLSLSTDDAEIDGATVWEVDLDAKTVSGPWEITRPPAPRYQWRRVT